VDFQPLITLLEAMAAVFDEMSAVSLQKERAILAGDTEAFTGFLRQENALTGKVAGLEKRRLTEAATLAEQLSIPPGDATLERLADAAPVPVQSALRALRARLTGLVTQQKALNARARDLLTAHVDYADMMLGMMVGPEDPLNNLYGAKGRDAQRGRQTPGLFDTQI
jgi:flagellar biosynthesis/type III secretory pathway chaperone